MQTSPFSTMYPMPTPEARGDGSVRDAARSRASRNTRHSVSRSRQCPLAGCRSNDASAMPKRRTCDWRRVQCEATRVQHCVRTLTRPRGMLHTRSKPTPCRPSSPCRTHARINRVLFYCARHNNSPQQNLYDCTPVPQNCGHKASLT